MTKPCIVMGCDFPAHGKGLCSKHTYRKRRGIPLDAPPLMSKAGSPQAFLEMVAKESFDGCVEWPFAKNEKGYGNVHVDGVSTTPHREVCRLAHGDPPTPNHHAAHFCNNRGCVNPAHISWKTPKENEADKIEHGTSWIGRSRDWAGRFKKKAHPTAETP